MECKNCEHDTKGCTGEACPPKVGKSAVQRLASFLLGELKWMVRHIPFFAVMLTHFLILDIKHPLSLWQVAGCTLLVLFAREYLNWIERKYGS